MSMASVLLGGLGGFFGIRVGFRVGTRYGAA